MTGLQGFKALSQDTQDKRVLRVHFDHDVTDADRKELVEAINAYLAQSFFNGILP